MRYAPFISALGDKHREARWARHCLALYHPRKRVKAGDYDSAIVDCDCAPFVNRVFIAGSFCIPGSRHNPKILWANDAKVVGDRIAESRPISRDFRTPELKRHIRIGRKSHMIYCA